MVNIINTNDNEPTPLWKYLIYNLNETDPLATPSSRSSNSGFYKQCKIQVLVLILITFMSLMKLFNKFIATCRTVPFLLNAPM